MADGPHSCVVVWTAFAIRVAKDEQLREGAPESANLKSYTNGLVAVEGLPENLPLRVRLFAGFLRWTAQYALAAAPIEGDDASSRSMLVPCDRKRCSRPAHPSRPRAG